MTTPLWGLDDNFTDHPGSPSTIMASHVSQSLTSLEALAAGTVFSKDASGSDGAFVCATFAGDPTDPAPPDPLTDMFRFYFRANHTPTGACTLDVGTSDGPGSIVRPGGTALESGDIKAGHIVIVVWDSANSRWTILNPSAPKVNYVISVDANYSWSNGATHVLVDASSADVTVTLPPIVADTKLLHVKKIDASSNYVHLIGDSGALIDGKSTQSFNSPHTCITVFSYGTEWYIQ